MIDFSVIITYGKYVKRTSSEWLNDILNAGDFRTILRVGQKIIIFSNLGVQMPLVVKAITHHSKNAATPYVPYTLQLEVEPEGESWDTGAFGFTGPTGLALAKE
jgi:hypothetical protein